MIASVKAQIRERWAAAGAAAAARAEAGGQRAAPPPAPAPRAAAAHAAPPHRAHHAPRRRRPTAHARRFIAPLDVAKVPHELHLYLDTNNAPASAIGETIRRVAEDTKAAVVVIAAHNKAGRSCLPSACLPALAWLDLAAWLPGSLWAGPAPGAGSGCARGGEGAAAAGVAGARSRSDAQAAAPHPRHATPARPLAGADPAARPLARSPPAADALAGVLPGLRDQVVHGELPRLPHHARAWVLRGRGGRVSRAGRSMLECCIWGCSSVHPSCKRRLLHPSAHVWIADGKLGEESIRTSTCILGAATEMGQVTQAPRCQH